MIEKISDSLDSLAAVRQNYYYSFDKSTGLFYESGSGMVNLLDSTVGQYAALGFQGFWRRMTFDKHDYLAEGLGIVSDSVNKVLKCVEETAFNSEMDYLKREAIIDGVHKLQVKVDYAAAGVLKLLCMYESQGYKKAKLIPYNNVYKKELPQKIKDLYEKMLEKSVQEEFQIKQRFLSQEQEKQFSEERQARMQMAARNASRIRDAAHRRLEASMMKRKSTVDPMTGLSALDIEKLKSFIAFNKEKLNSLLEKQIKSDPLNPFLYLRPHVTKFIWPVQYFHDKVVIHLKSSKKKGRKGKPLKDGSFKKVTLSVKLTERGLGKVLANGVSEITENSESKSSKPDHLREVADRERHFLTKWRGKRGIVRFKNVSRYFSKDKKTEKQSVLMRYYNRGDLLRYIRRPDLNLTREEKNEILLDVLYGLKCIHSDNAVHLDIKPDNILLETTSKSAREKGISAAICDFGFCSYLNETVSVAGTIFYMSPEIVESLYKGDKEEINPVGQPSDMWSVGATFWLLYTGKRTPAMQYLKEQKKLKLGVVDIMKDENAIPEPEKDTVEHLIWRMMRPRPKDRVTSAEALETLLGLMGKTE